MSEVKISEKSIAESIKIILVKKNLNIARLADMMDVSSTTLDSKLKRDNFSFKDIEKISEVLGLDYEVSFIIKEDEK